jgi:putative ABC transport system ATP-binding protein
MEVVKIENVARVYKIGKVETQALRGVNLSIENGEFTALVGPSGSGKTTLLQMIGCLDQPTTGKVIINSKDVTKLNRNQRADMRRGTIGFIFQFFALIPTLTAYENVEMPLLLNGHSPAERKDRVMELLKAVDLSDRANNRPDQLSGGQQQRVAIARALANDPPILIADEPTGSLDSVTAEHIFEVFEHLIAQQGKTIVMVTHDQSLAPRFSRTLRIVDGELDSSPERSEAQTKDEFAGELQPQASSPAHSASAKLRVRGWRRK